MNPYAILAAVLLWGASVGAVGVWQNNAGRTTEKLVYETRANTELSAANSKIKSLEEAYRLREQLHAAEMNAIDTQYRKELEDAKTVTDDLIVRARTGAIRLRDPGVKASHACGDKLPEAATGPGGPDGAGDRGLSADASEFRLALTGRGKRVSKKLASCQKLIAEDRR
jgi:hypothetical protein